MRRERKRATLAAAGRWGLAIGLAVSGTVAAALAAQAAEFESFASTLIYLDSNAAPANVTCYLSNAGDKSVRLKDFRIFLRSGATVSLDANTCGVGTSFNLAAKSACYIGTTHTSVGSLGFGCAALVADSAPIRGAIELRDASARVQASGDLTPPSRGARASGFTRVASPPMFGASNQTAATCVFTNVGATAAKIKNVEFVSSTGRIFTPTNFSSDCTEKKGVVTAPPGASCLFSSPVTTIDLQCRGEASGRPDIRGAMGIIQPNSAIPNFLPLE